MTITVGDIYTAFPTFKTEDMIKLCNGNKNLNGRTVVNLSNIASFGDKELSVFVAKREGNGYTSLLGKTEQAKINEASGIKKDENNKNMDNIQSNRIDMDTSVFDIATNKPKNN